MSHARQAAIPMTVAGFREWAARQPGKWELVDGQPRAMPPASATHGLIQARAHYLISRHLEDTGSPCRAATEAPVVPASFKRHNARVPDLAVTCTPHGEEAWDLPSPVLILEILSPTNEPDTRDNVWVYMTMPCVQQILLLDSTALRGELLARRADGTWPEEAAVLAGGDRVVIDAIGFACKLQRSYARTSLASG